MDAFFDIVTRRVMVRVQARICHGCFVDDPFDPDMWSVERVCTIHQEFDPPLLHTSNPNISGRELKPEPFPPLLESSDDSDRSDSLPSLDSDPEPDSWHDPYLTFSYTCDWDFVVGDQ